MNWIVAFGAGLASIASPCVLPLIPSYLGYLTGLSPSEPRTAAAKAALLRHGAAFVIGFSTVFIALGWAAGSLGQLFYHYQHPIRWVGGLIIILFGLSTLLGWELPLLGRTVRWQGRAQPGPLVASWFVGLTFAAGWTPCVGPILGSILVLAGTSPHAAIGLMAAYSAGLALPFLLMAYGVGAAAWFKRHSLRLQRAAGAMMTAVGVMLATGEFDRLAAWLTSALGFTGIG